ncbi:MAG: hypothetical protein VW576_02825 [Opitutae bacterium]
MENNVLPLILLLVVSISGCGFKGKPATHAVERPIIYDAWDARYSYQMETRRMVPMHQGRQVGRTWGRDESGKINHANYLSSNQENEEDLFVLHSKELDRKREKKWESSKGQRIDFIKNQMEILEEEENAPLVEVLIEEEEDEFFPPVFIPQGIDLTPEENPAGNENAQDIPPAFPFAPLP